MFTTLSGKTLHQEEEEHGDIWVRMPGVTVRMFKESLVEGGGIAKESDLIQNDEAKRTAW